MKSRDGFRAIDVWLGRAVWCLCVGGMANTQAAEAILPPPVAISQHVYAWVGPYDGPKKENRGYRMNLVFVVGAEAVAVLDTGYTPAMAREMLAHVRRITPLPVRYAVNSNSQPHRFMGNDVFAAAGAETITTPLEAERMAERGDSFASTVERILELPEDSVPAPAAPKTLIKTPRELNLGGGVTVRLEPVGATHTPDSLIAVIAPDKVVFTGDALYGNRLLAVIPESNVKHWAAVFDGLRRYKGYTFVPGHGQVGPLADFEFPTYQYLKRLNDYMSKAVDNDVAIDDAMKAYDQSAFAKLANFEELAGRNASWAYLEAEQAAFE